ncbi:NAD-dependent epimerase/dehydratase family protein [Actinoplanes sp. NPDC051343]|uniref:NAD-dependent epimerase/dehydratase family protein n=1 Tax=Actinoplanes sp. NPDC051343 TaxID=3363906 RepID=UPI0037926A0D
MRVLVAGSTGVLGRQVVPVLRAAGHDVIGLATRRTDSAEPTVIANAFDKDGLVDAVVQAKPDAVVHLMTAIPKRIEPKRLAKQFALTNRLRTEGTANLIAGARRAGADRIITQGLAYGYEPGPGVAREEDPLWVHGPAQFRPVARALVEHERLTVQAGGLVLRFGHLYGPGTAYAADGTFIADVQSGKVPLVGGGHATFSFTHSRDAAMAVLAGLDKDVHGKLNIVDDAPTPVAEWLPALATLLGAPEPKPAPAWLARLAVGGWGVAFMNELRGADNARARLQLDWRPGYRTWRAGFAAEL